MTNVLIVGAGQLGLMMAEAGARIGISVDRIDHVSGEILPGTSRTRIQLAAEDITETYPVITAELEHLLGNKLVEGLRDHDSWINSSALTILPSRDSQKDLLDQLSVATSPWQSIQNPNDIKSAQLRLGDNLVVKSIRDGYDGKGQWIVSADDTGDIPENIFGQIIAEKKINFSREVSLIGARFTDGSKHFYPLVENYHQQGMLRYTLAPAQHSDHLQEQAETMLSKVMDSLEYVGVLAMECFETDYGLLVNELAPRVHNSGHWTQLGANYSQFDLHLLAITGKPNPNPQQYTPHTMMLNLIGCQWNDQWLMLPGIQCYWYGKSWRENRKLGHINICGQSIDELAENCRSLMPALDELHREMLVKGLDQLTTS